MALDGAPQEERTGKGTLAEVPPKGPLASLLAFVILVLLVPVLAGCLISIFRKNRWCPSLRKTASPSLITQVGLRVDNLCKKQKTKQQKTPQKNKLVETVPNLQWFDLHF